MQNAKNFQLSYTLKFKYRFYCGKSLSLSLQNSNWWGGSQHCVMMGHCVLRGVLVGGGSSGGFRRELFLVLLLLMWQENKLF